MEKSHLLSLVGLRVARRKITKIGVTNDPNNCVIFQLCTHKLQDLPRATLHNQAVSGLESHFFTRYRENACQLTGTRTQDFCISKECSYSETSGL